MPKILKLLLSFTLLISNTIFMSDAIAAPTSNPNSYFDGFYIGAGIVRDNVAYNYKRERAEAGSIDSTDASYNSNGFSGNIFTGYGLSFDKFHIAVEANVSRGSAESSQTDYFQDATIKFQSTQNYKLRGSYGISILPGFKITNRTLLYGRVGYVSGDFKATFTNEYKSIMINESFSSSDNANLSGIRYGLGLTTVLTDNLRLRLDYSHTDYASQNISVSNAFFATQQTSNFKPRNDQFELGLIYRFA